MIQIREGSRISKLLYILTIAGEFPMCSISLLGNYQSYMRLIDKTRQECEFFDYETKERYTAKILTVVGRGRQKSLRLLSGVYPILEWLGISDIFTSYYGDFHFTGKLTERERMHRVAESYSMMLLAGVEINPKKLPKFQRERIQDIFIDKQCFYGSKLLKGVEKLEMTKNAYTRIIGAVFANKHVYAVYNTRSQVMKWCGKGESKAQINLEEVSRMNAKIHRVKSAILFGHSIDIARQTMEEASRNKRLELNFDSIYSHIHFIPLNQDGVRQLRILLKEDWKEELLSVLFTEEMRSYDKGSFEYDAKWDGKIILSFFDGDLARLQRFQFGASRTDYEYEVLCFPFQAEFLKSYLGDLAKITTIDMEVIENAMEIGGEN